MLSETLKHFIFVRFFPFQDPKFPHNVLDLNFLSTQLPLVQNIFRSLENQTNKNFDLLFIMHQKFFDDSKYEIIFSDLKDSTILPLKFIKSGDISGLVKAALDEYDFVIQSRMNFDDFIYKDAVEDTQSKVNECEKILGYGYCRGYGYAAGVLRFYCQLWNKGGHPMILQSLILKSSFAKNTSLFTLGTDHVNFKKNIKNFLERNGVEFSENMFQQNTTTHAFIYFRHELSHFHLVFSKKKSMESVFSDRQEVTPEDEITKKQPEEEFGFFHELKSIK